MATLPYIHCIQIFYRVGKGTTNTGLNLISTVLYFKHCMPYISQSTSSLASAVPILQLHGASLLQVTLLRLLLVHTETTHK